MIQMLWQCHKQIIRVQPQNKYTRISTRIKVYLLWTVMALIQ